MKTYNVITTLKDGSPVAPEGAGYSCLSQPELIPIYVRVYCYTDEQVKELLNNSAQYPFVAEIVSEEVTPVNIPKPEEIEGNVIIKDTDEVISVDKIDVLSERVWIKAEAEKQIMAYEEAKAVLAEEAVLKEEIVAEKEIVPKDAEIVMEKEIP